LRIACAPKSFPLRLLPNKQTNPPLAVHFRHDFSTSSQARLVRSQSGFIRHSPRQKDYSGSCGDYALLGPSRSEIIGRCISLEVLGDTFARTISLDLSGEFVKLLKKAGVAEKMDQTLNKYSRVLGSGIQAVDRPVSSNVSGSLRRSLAGRETDIC
jgi:hypothetical protein